MWSPSRLDFDILLAGMLGCAFVLPGLPAQAATYKEKILYSFCSQQNCADGSEPVGGLLDVNGTLYGTTSKGGAYGGGTVFSLDLNSGTETVLYSFCSQQNCADGADPLATLIDVNGILYGTTAAGGGTGCNGYGCGTIFSIDPANGAGTVLYSFCSQPDCTDGSVPAASLIDVNGTLYGTTETGGTGICSCGTAFAFDPDRGVESVLYSFCSLQNCADGEEPHAGLINKKGTLYGTTLGGGIFGWGTAYELDRKTGGENVLHSFCQQNNGDSCADGAGPVAGLTKKNGIFYGTTGSGGIDFGCCGTVFSLDPSTGIETPLHLFCRQQNCIDGSAPDAGVIAIKDALYGTTEFGGTGSCNGGCGTVFSLDLITGAAAVVHSFAGGTDDGAFPSGSLIAVNGTVYGMAGSGGAYGKGAVFVLKKRR